MNHTFQAVYEHGLLRPLEPVDLSEHEVVSLTVTTRAEPVTEETEDKEEAIRRQQAALMAFVERAAAEQVDMPDDGLTNRDHDKIIYGS
jgi:predicted DNA-binding antitoxin AbrB/MazE fold protein